MAHWIGTSGWSYDHWQNILYPANTPVNKRLEWYIETFKTVEANNTYYHWPREAIFSGWRQKIPEDFMFTVKASRILTHQLKLEHPEESLAFMEKGLHELGDKCGVFLVQLPPYLGFDLPRLQYFLSCLPPGIRTTIEFRNSSWDREETYKALENAQVAYCVMSGANLPCIMRATAPFVYIRMHGPDTNSLYSGLYSENDMHWWADRIDEWETNGYDIYIYFNNDGSGNAVHNAKTLIDYCEQR